MFHSRAYSMLQHIIQFTLIYLALFCNLSAFAIRTEISSLQSRLCVT